MISETVIFVCLKLFFGFTVAFLALLAWAKTREGAWMFIIAGTLVRYLELIYSILIDLEVVDTGWGSVGDGSLAKILLTILPLFFYSVGFFLFLLKRKKY